MKRLSRNLLAIVVSDAGRRLLGFFAVTYLTRTISVNDFGAMNIGLTLLSYALMVSSGGLSAYGTREVVGNDDPLLVNGILGTRLMNAAMVYLVIAAGGWFLITDRLTLMCTLLFCLSVFTNAFFLDWYYQGKEAMGSIGLSRFGAAIVYLGLVLMFVQRPSEVLWVTFAALASDLVVTIWLLERYHRQHPQQSLLPVFTRWRPLMQRAFPIGAGSIFAHLSINFPPLAIGILSSNLEVGYYSAATKLVFFLLMLDRVIGTVLLPASARFYAASAEALSMTLATAMKWILVATVPLAVGGTFVAGKLVPAVFGVKYVPAAGAFRVLVWYFLFTMLHTVYANGLLAVRQEKVFGKVMLASLCLYVVCVLLGAYVGGIVGAAAGVVFAEALTVVAMHRGCSRFFRLRVPENFWRVLLAGGCLAVFLYAFPGLRLLPAVLLGAAVYGTAAFGFRAVTKADIAELRARL